MKFIKCIIFISCHNKVVYYVEFVSCKLKIRKKNKTGVYCSCEMDINNNKKAKVRKLSVGLKQ